MRKKTCLHQLGLAVLALALTASGGTSLSFHDFIGIKRLSDPSLSPDGEQLAFVVTSYDLSSNRGKSDIWLVPTKGGEPRRLTSNPSADYNPRWSPDGKTIAFISTREGTPQIWKIRPDGGEAVRISEISTGASGIVWSPSGGHFAFNSSVYPECPDDDCNRQKSESAEKDPVKAQIFGTLLFRHWNRWLEGRRSHVFTMAAGGGPSRDMTPGDHDSPPLDLGSSQDYSFSPDGNEICYVSNIDPTLKKSLGTNNDLFTIDLKGKRRRTLTTGQGNDNLPRYSPDGRYIAYRSMERPGYEADRYRLFLWDRTSGERKNLTPDLDRSIGDLLWAPDSASILVTYEDMGHTTLSRIHVADGKREILFKEHTLHSPQLSSDGNVIYALKDALDLPSEIYALDLKNKILKPLTRINEEILDGIRMNPAEEFWFEGAGHDRVHGFLVKPPNFDPGKKYPLVMLIHGGPQGAWADNFHFRWNAQMFASPGFVVAMINFHGSTGYGQSFTDSIRGDWGGKPYVDILKGLDHLLSRHEFIDEGRLAAAGASYGGYMIDWLAGHTDRFSCLISHAGVFDLRSMHGATEELWFPEWELLGPPWANPEMYAKWSPSFFVQNFKTPCLVIHGQLDFRVPVTQGFQMFTALQRMDVPSKLLYFPDEGHFVTKPRNAQLWWKTMLGWLADYLR